MDPQEVLEYWVTVVRPVQKLYLFKGTLVQAIEEIKKYDEATMEVANQN